MIRRMLKRAYIGNLIIITRYCTMVLILILISLYTVGCGGCGDSGELKTLRIFHASGFTPVMESLRAGVERDIKVRIETEASGSQVVCRKVEELGRQSDLLIIADNRLVTKLLPTSCSWRLDFATDEVVLGIGVRAPGVDDAETDWFPILLRDDVRFGMVDKNQGPIGYRAGMVLQLEAQRRGHPELAESITRRTAVVVDDVTRLAPLLRTGDLDYAFLYRSTCLAMDIRFIELHAETNLSNIEIDYSSVSVTFEKLGAFKKRMVTIQGAPAVWTLTVPDRGADMETAARFARQMLVENFDLVLWHGFIPIDKPLFYGPEDSFEPFKEWADYAGKLQ